MNLTTVALLGKDGGRQRTSWITRSSFPATTMDGSNRPTGSGARAHVLRAKSDGRAPRSNGAVHEIVSDADFTGHEGAFGRGRRDEDRTGAAFELPARYAGRAAAVQLPSSAAWMSRAPRWDSRS